MNYQITQKSLAHCLSIIAEAGRDGFNYDSAVNALSPNYRYRSTKTRWMLAASPEFDCRQFTDHLAYAAKAGFVESDDNLRWITNHELHSNPVNIKLSLSGWEQIERYDRPLLEIWAKNVLHNLPTVVVSVVTALLIAWTTGLLGLD